MEKKWLKEVYEANPETDVLYAVEKTKLAFYTEHAANDHARTYGAEVVKVTRAEVEAEVEKAKAAEEAKKAKAAEEAEKAKAAAETEKAKAAEEAEKAKAAAAEEMPSDKWTVAKLQEWLTAKEIAFDEKATKAQMLALVPTE